MWAIVNNGSVVETFEKPKSLELGGVKYPAAIFEFWSEEQLNAIAAYTVVIEPEPPQSGAYAITGETLEYDGARDEVVITRQYAEIQPPVPEYVTKLQLVRALRQRGYETALDAAMEQADAETQKDWGLAQTVNRTDPLVVQFAASIGVDAEEADEIFRLAETL